jgi:hypothetical protein
MKKQKNSEKKLSLRKLQLIKLSLIKGGGGNDDTMTIKDTTTSKNCGSEPIKQTFNP